MDTVCAVCTEPLCSDVVSTECGHLFHKQCVMKWYNAKKTAGSVAYKCPTCLTPQKGPKGLRKIFFNQSGESPKKSEVADAALLVRDTCAGILSDMKKVVADLNAAAALNLPKNPPNKIKTEKPVPVLKRRKTIDEGLQAQLNMLIPQMVTVPTPSRLGTRKTGAPRQSTGNTKPTLSPKSVCQTSSKKTPKKCALQKPTCS